MFAAAQQAADSDPVYIGLVLLATAGAMQVGASRWFHRLLCAVFGRPV